MKLFSSLRSRILLLLIGIVLPVLCILFYSAYEQGQTAVKKLKEELDADVKILSGLMEKKLEGVRQLLIVLSHEQSILETDASSCNKYLFSIKKHFLEYVNFGATDPKGNIFCSAVPMTKPVNASDLAWFRNAIKSEDIGIGEYQIGRITGKHILNIGYAARDESGKIKAVVFVPFYLDELNKSFKKIGLPPERVLLMLDRNGTILVRHPDYEKWAGEKVKESELIKTILSQNNGMIETKGVDNIKRIYSFSPVAGSDNSLFISIGIPKDIALSDTNRQFNRNLALFGLFVVLSLTSAFIISRLARQSEEKLVKSESKYRELVQNANSIILRWNPDGTINFLNEYGQAFFGYTENELLERHVVGAIVPDTESTGRDLRPLMEQICADPKAFELNINENIKRNGERAWISWTNKVVLDEKGQIKEILSIGSDITERKKAEEALHRSEEWFRSLFENMLEGYAHCKMIFDDENRPVDFVYLNVNSSFERLTGLKNVAGKKETEIFPGVKELHPEMFETFGRVALTGKPEKYEIDFKPLKQVFILSIYSIEKGYCVLTFDNITERKKAEEELRITNEELSAINRIISTTTTTTTTGVKEILEKVLDEALNITGLEGGTICMVTPDETLQLAAQRETSDATIKDLTENAVKIGECLCGECARDHKPLILWDRNAVLEFSTREAQRGEDIRFHAAFPLIIGKRCLGVLCVFTRTDKKPTERSLKLLETVTSQIAITVDNAQMFEEIAQHAAILEHRVKERTAELQRNEAALTNLVDDLEEKSKELEKANIRLKELDRLKSMFIASMSHELRTPLNSIIGFSSIILNEWLGPLNNEQRENLSSVLRSGKHLLALINDVIDVSKIEAGMIEVNIDDFDLDSVIHEAVDSFKNEIKDKKLKLKVESIHQKMHTDRRRLLQSVMNLMSNAVKFTEQGSVRVQARLRLGSSSKGQGSEDLRVKLQGSRVKESQKEETARPCPADSLATCYLPLAPDRDFIEISVEDTGIGIKEDDIPRLFNAFVRLESHLKATVLGTGLGLYLTKKLVQDILKGEIMVVSKEGKGSRFTLRMPVKTGSSSK